MGLSIGHGIGIPFKKGGQLWSTYWTTREPSNLVVVAVSDTVINVLWDKPSLSPDGYRLYVSTDGGVSYSLNSTLTIDVDFKQLTSLTANTTYDIKLTGYTGVNESTGITGSATTKSKWYLAGGITNSHVVGAYSAIGAATKALSLKNLSNPGTNDLTETGTITWSTTDGWGGFTNSSKYLTGPTYKSNTYSIIMLVKNCGADAYGRAFSCESDATGTKGTYILPTGNAGTGYFRQANEYISFASKTSGVFGASQTKFYIDKNPSGNLTPSGVEVSAACTIGVNSFNKLNQFNGKVLAFVIYDYSLTDAQIIAVETEMYDALVSGQNDLAMFRLMRDFTSLTRYASNPVLNYGVDFWGTVAVDTPYASPDNKIGSYYYALTQISNGSWDWIDLAVVRSSDKLSWSPVGSSPVIECVGGTWEDHWMLHPCIVKKDSTYYAFYTAKNAANLGQLGVATSTDLINWTKYGSNPIYTAPTGNVDACWIVKNGSTYYLYYYDNPAIVNTSIKYATSTDLLTWTYGGECFTPAIGDWDRGLCPLDPCVVQRRTDGIFEMIYTSGEYTGDYTQNIGYAVSIDGKNFVKRSTFVLTPTGAGLETGFLGNPVLFLEDSLAYLYYCSTIQITPPLTNNVGMLAIIST